MRMFRLFVGLFLSTLLIGGAVLAQPMSGTYTIGDDPELYDYVNFSAAVTDLTSNGVVGAVIFEVYGTSFVDSLVIGPIAGASATNTITFREHVGALDEPVTITRSTGQAVIRLLDADYIIIDGIDIEATDSCLRGVQLYSGADYNAVRNAVITAPDVTSYSTYGVHVKSGGNDYNLFENLTVSGAGYGIRLDALSSSGDIENEVRNCSVLEGRYGIMTGYQHGSSVHDCDIQPGWDDASVQIYGIYISSQSTGDTVFCYNNKIHNLRTSGSGAINGIYTLGSAVRIYNNFVCDFQCTGTGAVYGIRVYNGNAEICFNSVYIGDVETTGGSQGINGIYQQNSNSSAILKNNIIQIEEPTSTCYAINHYQGTLVSDYNAVYSSGPGVAYNMGRDGSTTYATLALWQTGTAYDANSLEGDPGFISTTDLHIADTYNLVDGVAIPIEYVTFDIDNEERGGTTDIGADEYSYLSYNHDYGVIRFLELLPSYVSTTPYVIQAEVKNWGTNNESNVAVRLYYNNEQQDEELVSLLAGEQVVVNFDWMPPDVDYQEGELKVKAFCPSDGNASNDSLMAAVVVVGLPMHGIYDIGGGEMDFASFAEATAALSLRGIDDETIFDVYEGTYDENVSLVDPIAGASLTDQVIFRAHPSALLDVVTVTSSGEGEAIVIDSCDFVTFDGINVLCSGLTDIGFYIDDDADYVTIKNAAITGRDSSLSAVSGIVVSHDACDNVTIDNCTISGCYYGVRMNEGRSGTESSNTEIKNCSISSGNCSILLDNSPDAHCHHNVLQPSGSDIIDVEGILVDSQPSGSTVYVYANKIYNIRRFSRTTTSDLCGIQARPATGAYAYIYNNMIWGHSTPDPRPKGAISGILCGSGNLFVYHNSILIPELGMHPDSLDLVAGIYITSTSSYTTSLMNNIVDIVEDAPSYALYRSSTCDLISDYNCVYGTEGNFHVGYSDGASYTTLAEWQSLEFDLNSVNGDPGYTSLNDLHIYPGFVLVDGAGAYLMDVQTDIDGDVRDNPPDIGADEYDVQDAPDPVIDLTVIRDAITSDVILRWSAAAGALSYNIYAGSTSDFEIGPSTFVGATGDLSFTHTDIITTESCQYYVVLSSTDDPPSMSRQSLGQGYDSR